jgi:hypothetical protein
MKMSNTPRTDAEIDDARNVALDFETRNPPPQQGENLYVVPADFARILERENLKLRAALEKLRDCDFVITLPDRMDAVRQIARAALDSLPE